MKKIYLPQGAAKNKILILILAFAIGNASFWTNITVAQASYSAGSIISSTNSQRVSNGLGSLTSNSTLSAAANAKAQDMFANQYFAHTSPQGKTPWDFIHAAGYDYTYAGENLAIGYNDISELMSAWMASPTHRENILNPNFREIGVAVVSGTYEGAETLIAVQEFGAQESAPAEAVASESVTPEPDENIESPQTTVQTESTPTSTPVSERTFSIIKDKSSFYPQTIFSGEEVTLMLTIKGEVKTLEAEISGEKINVLETSSVSGSDEKTYTVKKKIEKEGESDIVFRATDKNGNSGSLILGKIRVNKTVISKENLENQNQGFVAGVKINFKKYWYIYTLSLGIVLALLAFIASKRIKFGKKLGVRLALWNL